MAVKPVHKLGDLGVIPDDWDLKSLAEIGEFRTGPFGTLLKANEYYTDEGVPLVSVKDIGDGKLTFDEETPLVPLSVIRRLPEYVLSSGDLVFGRKGGVNRSAIVQEHQSGCFLGSDGIRVRLSKTCYPPFVAYQLQSDRIRTWLLQNATGTTMPSMSQSILRGISLPLPPTLPEQRAIAAALSDVDALLTALDAFIAKKRLIKQGVVYELLSGKKRLSDFTANWRETRLGEVADLLKGSGLSKSKITLDGKCRCLLYGELFTTYGRVITEVISATDANEGVLSQAGDVLMPGSTTTVGIDLAVASALMVADVALGGDVNIIRRTHDADYSPTFLANYITYVCRNSIAEMAQGITIYHLYGKDLKRLVIRLPELDEQQVISDILVDIDAEMTALEAQRGKISLLKQGMMQELLTGRIRLV